MNAEYIRFDKIKERERLAVFEATADRLGTTSTAIEKDTWVCRVIDALFKGLGRQPKLYLKGGTSLSKGYSLIQRFSEDIDIVVSRPGLGIRATDDPLNEALSGKKRRAAIEATKEKCSNHVLGRMLIRLSALLPDCTLEAEDDDEDQASLRVKYPSLLPKDPYLKPWVKIECGARGAREPDVKRTIIPYIQEELAGQFNLAIQSVTLIAAERTFWEKALILHGIHCGFRDCGRRLGDKNLVSRHYYDLAMMANKPEGIGAVRDHSLLGMVRIHKLTLFKKAWEKLEEAVPGTLHLVPQTEILSDLEDDYSAMSGMMFGKPPSFEWVIQELTKLEEAINELPCSQEPNCPL